MQRYNNKMNRELMIKTTGIFVGVVVVLAVSIGIAMTPTQSVVDPYANSVVTDDDGTAVVVAGGVMILTNQEDPLYNIVDIMTKSVFDSYSGDSIESFIHRLSPGTKYVLDNETSTRYVILEDVDVTSETITWSNSSGTNKTSIWNRYDNKWENMVRDRIYVSNMSSTSIMIFAGTYTVTGYTIISSNAGSSAADMYSKIPVDDDTVTSVIAPQGVILPNGTRVIVKFTSAYAQSNPPTYKGTSFLFHDGVTWNIRFNGFAISYEAYADYHLGQVKLVAK